MTDWLEWIKTAGTETSDALSIISEVCDRICTMSMCKLCEGKVLLWS